MGLGKTIQSIALLLHLQDSKKGKAERPLVCVLACKSSVVLGRSIDSDFLILCCAMQVFGPLVLFFFHFDEWLPMVPFWGR